MKLRKPCEAHGRYDEHYYDGGTPELWLCPGGVFLPDDTLVIEKVDGEWPEWATEITIPPDPVNHPMRRKTDLKPPHIVFDGHKILDALSVRETE